MTPRSGTGRALGLVAVACLIFFVAVVASLPLAQRGHYHLVSQTISELALGRWGWLMNVAFVVLGVGTAALALALRTVVPAATWTSRLLLAAAPFDVVSALFHAVLMGHPMTGRAIVHVGAGITTWLLTIAAMFCAVRPFRRSVRWQAFARPTLLWAWTSAGCMLVLGPNVVGQDHFGLGQRATAATFTLWMLATGVRATARPSTADEPAAGEAVEPSPGRSTAPASWR